MKNILVVTIDSLSQWYINHSGDDMPFFKRMARESLFFSDVFSTGPFTESAISGFWYGVPALSGWGYLFENNYNDDSIFETFRKMDYDLYLGRLIPFYSERMACDYNNIERENPVDRAFEHVWRGRIVDFCSIKKKDLLDTDLSAVERVLDCFFSTYKNYSCKVERESEHYTKDKKEYISDIYNNAKDSVFFKTFYSDLFKACNEKGCVELERRTKNHLSNKEILLCEKIRVMNRLRMLQCNRRLYVDEELSPVLDAPRNRCMVSNDNVATLIRNRNESLPGLGEELADFLKWYDEGNRNKSFFAYIHNYDFHYPENFLDTRFENDADAYYEEIEELYRELDCLIDVPMSITKQLTLRKIDRIMCEFVNQLKNRCFFDDSIMIITADHGMTNFMYPVKRRVEERWNYNTTNFNVPLYVVGFDKRGEIGGLISTQQIPSILKELALDKDISHKSEDYLITSWINGNPDLMRKPIKYGFRSLNTSATIQSKFSEFIISSDILGLYDLDSDPDELLNINSEVGAETKRTILRCFAAEWERIICEYLLGWGGCQLYTSKYHEIIEKELGFLFLYNKTIEYHSKEVFYNTNHSIVLCGTDKKTRKYIADLPDSVKVDRIMTLDSQKYYCGLPCECDFSTINKENVIVIASEREVEYAAVLKNNGIARFFLDSQLI